ncbi:nuclear transport factor 2 family protein [Rhodococcus sp. PD04]|uniref:nuclear transport factor 2 family protein n=1 Tax=Rhodococcus sp. PD04 TaxID=3109594 RepID=UPI002DDBD122|nr:nuclear transport factor 2 family protein [Rhodococcus sp. PD04]WSE21900.1 nuclear transport factor 2 family protein [Rhodococcus sp. PD04]
MSETTYLTDPTALDAILHRLDVLESREAITGLMVDYMAATDSKADKGIKVARLFTEDGAWESVGPHGNPGWAAVGHEALTKKFDRNVERMPFSAHFVTNPSIDLDGDVARGRFMYFQACTYRADQPLWIAGSYDNDFRRVDGKWLISYMRVHNFFTTPFDQGWVKVPHMDTP